MTRLALVHGLGYGASWGWGPAADLLARHFELVRPDHPRAATVGELAESAARGLDGPTHVLGTSLGGMVAQELALSRPELVDRLVLVSTTPGGPASHPMPEVTVRLMSDPSTTLRDFVANALADSRNGLVEKITALRLANPPDPETWQAHAAAGAAFDAFDRIPAIAAPTLVLHGTADRVVDPRNAELLAARIPGARLELLPGAGHLPFWEEPERFAGLVREFLC